MSETPATAPEPGQALYAQLQRRHLESAPVPPAAWLQGWDDLDPMDVNFLEDAAQAVIAAAKWPANLTLADTLSYLAGQWESNASPHNFLDPAEQAVARRYAADLKAALRAATKDAAQPPQPAPLAADEDSAAFRMGLAFEQARAMGEPLSACWEAAYQAAWEHWTGQPAKPAPELAAAMAEARRYREALEGVRAIILEGDNSTEGSRLRRSRAVIRAALEGR